MRVMPLLVASGLLASCSTAPQQTYRAPDKQAEFAQLVAGKVAQKPITCLPHYRTDDMRVIDDNTVAFRDGANRTYVAHLNGGCNNLGMGSYALVTLLQGSPDLCSGQIARVVDTVNGMTVGSCSFEEFTPYVRQGA
jgi:major membrane immunogen (membrane-anchored lipoprotein)